MVRYAAIRCLERDLPEVLEVFPVFSRCHLFGDGVHDSDEDRLSMHVIDALARDVLQPLHLIQ